MADASSTSDASKGKPAIDAPAEPKAGAPEIAYAWGRRDITRQHLNPDGTLYNEDTVLQMILGGDLRQYEDLLRDDQVRAAFEQRRKAVCSANWSVEAGADDGPSKAAAAWLEANLRRVGWDRVTDLMLYGVFYGWSVAELLWDVYDGKLGWRAIKVRNRRRFLFQPDGRGYIDTGAADANTRIYTDPPYFWTINSGADHSDNPYGQGLAHSLYWPVRFKRDGVRFWLVYLEKFAMPTALGKFKDGEQPDKRAALLQALIAICTEAGVTIPESMTVELLEAKRTGSSDYDPFRKACEVMIQKIILGQTLTSEVGSTGGNRALGDVHMKVRQDLVKGDADLIAESFNQGPATWLTVFNFAGATPPRVRREVEEPTDLDALSQQLERLHRIGFVPNLAMVQANWGGDMEEAPEPEPLDLTGQPGQLGGMPGRAEQRPNFAAAVRALFPDQEALDGAVDAIETRAARLTTAQLLGVLEFASDHTPQELLAELGNALPGWADDKLGEALARVIFVAQTWGRLNAGT